MKEIIKASLAGIGFVFDQDAYQITEAYLDKLAGIYKSNPDGREIIADIEARMVEIILSRQTSEQVVDRETAEEVISQMGTPEQVGGESTGSVPVPVEGPFPRRLYRNLDGAKLGGVCNGLGNYFDVDPVFVRIAMASPLFFLIIFPSVGFHALNAFLGSLFGAICLLYIIMWFAVPAAKTPRQKLEMKGRRITAYDIEREMAASGGNLDRRQPQSAMARLFSVLGTVILFGLKLLLLLIGFAFAVAAFGVFISIIGLFVGSSWMVLDGWDDVGILAFGNASGIPARAFMAMFLGVILIPLVMLVYQLIRLTLGRKNNNTLMWILGGAWILLAVFTTITALSNRTAIQDFRGIRYDFSDPRETTPGQDGWEIYEENVRRFREEQQAAAEAEAGPEETVTVELPVVEETTADDGVTVNPTVLE
ncbi:MAG: PspC domain-containing protein [Alistipes sp.]|nr:PspC domain-containing protein [Alistipes sp.]